MSRILKRPMFRRGGSTNTGIMSGLVDRRNYSFGGIDRELLKKDTQAISDILSELAPVPKTRLPLGEVGLALASGADPIEALNLGYKKFTTADDIRRAQIAKRGQGALSTALQLQLKKGKTTRTLTEPELEKLNLPKDTIAQVDQDGKINIVSKPTAKEVEKRADLTGTIGLLKKVEENYLKAGKPVGPIFNLDPDRLAGTIQQFTGGEKGKTLATLEADIRKTTTFLTKAISGAQVSDKEREFIEKLIPQLSDTEVVFEAKLKSLRRYLGDAVKNYGGDVEALMRAGDADDSLSAKNYLLTEEKNLEDMSDAELEALRDKLKQQISP
jgi:hypothetical protein